MAKALLLFIGTDAGAILFSNPNNIGRWLRIGQPFREHAVRALWPLPDDPLVVFAAVVGQGLQRSDDGGQNWHTALAQEIHSLTGAPHSVNPLYALGVNGELYSSEDAGDNWQIRATLDPAASGADALIAAETGQACYVSSGTSVWILSTAKTTWTRYGQALSARIQGLACVPDQSEQLYVVAGQQLYSCNNPGGQWQQLNSPQPATGAVAVLGGKKPVLLLAQPDGGIQRSDDTGATWTTVGSELDWGGTINVITPASYHIDTAFAGSVAGRLAITTDRGRTWQLIKADLPPIQNIAAARLA